jgi:tRNA-specific 2-thiouridylase
MDKPTVRLVAAELGLAIADKPDSQDICFVPEGKYTTVIDRIRPQGALPGDMVHMDGRVLGRHEGVTRYTIGQRRGLNIAVGDPLFVVKIDADKRQVIVGPREALLTQALSPEGRQLAGRRRTAWKPPPPTARRCWPACARPANPSPAVWPWWTATAPGVRRAGGRRRPRPGLRALRPADPERVLGGGFIAGTTRTMELEQA